MQTSQKVAFKQANVSSSAILSAVTGEIRRWIMMQFPEGFFKYIRITSGLPSVDDTEGEPEMLKKYRKSNPALAIRPRLQFQNDLMGGSLQNPSPFYYENLGPDSHYYTLATIPDYMQRISFLLEYWKCSFTIGIRVETEVQALDIVGMLNTRIFPENYFYIERAPLLIEIPVSILARSAADMGYNLTDPDSVSAYLDLLQHSTKFPLDIKLRRDNGKKIIAFMMTSNILCKCERLPDVEANKRGRVQDDTKIQFEMTAQLSYPKLWKVLTELPILDDHGNLKDTGDRVSITTLTDSGFAGKGDLTMNYAMMTELPPSIPGTSLRLVFKQNFIVETNKLVDTLELGKILPKDVEAFIDDALANHKQDILSEACIFRLWRDEQELDSQSFHFDFRTKTLNVDDPRPNYIYRVGIYMEMNRLHRYEASLQGVNDLSQHFDHDLIEGSYNNGKS
jgi:hypothetical protein